MKISTVIDIGASDGTWSAIVHRFYPKAYYLLIEANPYHHDGLQRFKLAHPNSDFVLAAAGDKEGEIYFDARDPLGGSATDVPVDGQLRVPMITVDEQVKKRELMPPFFLKLDTHGFEIPILEGSMYTLANTSLIYIETYNFKLTADSLRFHEICSFLDSKGFRPVDIADPLYRHNDSVLWQFDLLFMRADRPEFLDNAYN